MFALVDKEQTRTVNITKHKRFYEFVVIILYRNLPFNKVEFNEPSQQDYSVNDKS